MSEYNDAVQRAQRLSVAREAILSTNSCSSAILSLQTDDLEIYLRWLISHFYSIKSYIHFMKLLEWFPYFINNLNDGQKDKQKAKSQSQLSHRQQQMDDLSSMKSSTNFSTFIGKYEERKSFSESNRYSNILDKIYLESTNAIVPTDENLNAISFCKKNFVRGDPYVQKNFIFFLLFFILISIQ